MKKEQTKTPLLFLSAALVLTALLSSCAAVSQQAGGNIQRGIASWYGDDFHGKITSNRETYDMHAMTAAHQSLPFNTHVRVTNLDNNQQVIVRINDRGPFVKGRIIDMSFAAAAKLGMVDTGIVPVRIEVIPHLSPSPDSQKFVVQVGSYLEIANATQIKRKLQKKYPAVCITVFKTSGAWYYRVRVNARSQSDAKKLLHSLLRDGYKAYILEEYLTTDS